MADNDMTHTAEIFKTVLPFVDARTKTTMDLLVKFYELMGALRSFRRNRLIVSSNSNESQKVDLETILTKVKPVCNDRERSFVDQMLSIFQAKRMMEMYNSYMSMMKSMQEDGESEGGGFGAENFAMNLAGFDLSSIFGGSSKPEASGFDNGFSFGPGSGIDLNSIFGTGPAFPNSSSDTKSTPDLKSASDSYSTSNSDSKDSAAEAFKTALEEALAASGEPSSDSSKDLYANTSTDTTDGDFDDSDRAPKVDASKDITNSSKPNVDSSTSDSTHNDGNSEDNGNMLNMLKTMIPPDQMNTFENLRMLFNTMSYDDSRKADQKKE